MYFTKDKTNIKRVDYPIFPTKYSVFADFRSGLLAFLRANAEPPRYAVGSHLFALPAGVEQASAPIYIAGDKIHVFIELC